MDARKLTKLQMIALGKTLFLTCAQKTGLLEWHVDRNRKVLEAKAGKLLFVSVSRRQLINIAKLRGLL